MLAKNKQNNVRAKKLEVAVIKKHESKTELAEILYLEKETTMEDKIMNRINYNFSVNEVNIGLCSHLKYICTYLFCVACTCLTKMKCTYTRFLLVHFWAQSRQ